MNCLQDKKGYDNYCPFFLNLAEEILDNWKRMELNTHLKLHLLIFSIEDGFPMPEVDQLFIIKLHQSIML